MIEHEWIGQVAGPARVTLETALLRLALFSDVKTLQSSRLGCKMTSLYFLVVRRGAFHPRSIWDSCLSKVLRISSNLHIPVWVWVPYRPGFSFVVIYLFSSTSLYSPYSNAIISLSHQILAGVLTRTNLPQGNHFLGKTGLSLCHVDVGATGCLGGHQVGVAEVVVPAAAGVLKGLGNWMGNSVESAISCIGFGLYKWKCLKQ